VERGKGVVSRQKERLAASVQAGKQAYRETTSEEGVSSLEMGPPAEGI
jgi:hypothetical protein